VVNTPEFAKAQRQRKKLETLFAELTNQIGRRRLRLREVEVRAGAVPLGSGGSDHQTTRAVPEPTAKSCSASHAAWSKQQKKTLAGPPLPTKKTFC
jgi:hypothetical protein